MNKHCYQNYFSMSQLKRIHDYANDFLHLFFPEYCLGCSQVLYKHERNICLACYLDMPKANYHNNPADNALNTKFRGRTPLRFALAYLLYRKGSAVQAMIHKLKYDGERDMGVYFGQLYGQDLREKGYHFDLIVPVPLHPHKKQSRGYNQAAAFAEGLAQELNIPFDEDVLAKHIFTKSQTKKSRWERWAGLESSIGIKKADLVQAKHILLVDDVVTTGSTLEMCGQELLNAGCASLSVAAIANAAD